MQLSYQGIGIVCQVASLATAELGTACSGNKRARRGRATVTASDTTTLREVKLAIHESLEFHPMNMDCYVRGRMLVEDDFSLGALEVLCNDVIDVVKADPPRTDNDDFGSIVEWQKMVSLDGDRASCVARASPGKERGFVDTLLVGGGGAPAQAAHDSVIAVDDADDAMEAMDDGAGPSHAS